MGSAPRIEAARGDITLEAVKRPFTNALRIVMRVTRARVSSSRHATVHHKGRLPSTGAAPRSALHVHGEEQRDPNA